MKVLCAILLLISDWHGVLCESNTAGLDFATEEESNSLVSIIATHYRQLGTYVNIRVRNGNTTEATLFQQDLTNDLVRSCTEWMITVAYNDLPFSAASVEEAMLKLWNIWILNVVVIVDGHHGEHIAYSYDPYREDKCGSVESIEIGRYIDGEWSTPVREWFPDRTANFHGCPLKVGVVDLKPFSMFRKEGNQTVHFGLEVHIAESIAGWLNFSIQFVMPRDNLKWGTLRAENSTGLVGMIQRREVAFGFGSLGLSIARHIHLKPSTPNHMTQMIMAIPPKRPYTSIEKLFQPFTIYAWTCIVVGYTLFGLVTLVLLKLSMNPIHEPLPNPLYTLWVLLMGGSGPHFRMDSWRIFIIGFIINTLVIRTLYQAGMFERLQASASLASDLNTLDAINKAGLYYTMYSPTVQFFKDNPKVPNSHIRVVQNDSVNSDELYYELSQDKLGGVVALPLDCTAYYVKRNGKRGVVYIGKNTGFTYNIGMHFPKATPLQEPFNAWIHKLHASGLTRFWTEEFRDNRYWTNAKEKPDPASLKWNQISGGFLLCGVMLLLATLVFLGEVIFFHYSSGRTRTKGKANQEGGLKLL
uniref:Putative ionotropic receptor ligand binding domain-containing protein n=1 Tax=Anopheles atroparvus TaxID=41427 RepID=A0A182IST4_ANOAO